MRSVHAFAAAVVILTLAGSADATPFTCDFTPPTLRMESEGAHVILFGRFENPVKHNELGDGETDLIVLDVIRSHPILKNPGKLVVPRYLPGEKGKANTYVVFGEISKGKLSFYSGRFTSPACVPYVRGILALDAQKRVKMLGYYVDYLEHADEAIAVDAFRELQRASVADRFTAARSMTPAKVWTWLRDPKVDPSRKGFYASFLASCGNAEDADSLVEWMKGHELKKAILSDAMVSVLLLNPKKHLPRVKGIAHDGTGAFLERFAILKAVRTLREMNLGAMPRAVCEEFFTGFLDQGDIADIAVEDFRRWQRWDLTERIVGMYGKKPHDIPITRRAILRFALQSPRPAADALVTRLRKEDRELVEYAEEFLKSEKDAQTPPK